MADQNPQMDQETMEKLRKTIPGEFKPFQDAMKFELDAREKRLEAETAGRVPEFSQAEKKKMNSRDSNLQILAMTAKAFSTDDHPPSAVDSVVHGIANPPRRPPRQIGVPCVGEVEDWDQLPKEEQDRRIANFKRVRAETKAGLRAEVPINPEITAAPGPSTSGPGPVRNDGNPRNERQ